MHLKCLRLKSRSRVSSFPNWHKAEGVRTDFIYCGAWYEIISRLSRFCFGFAAKKTNSCDIWQGSEQLPKARCDGLQFFLPSLVCQLSWQQAAGVVALVEQWPSGSVVALPNPSVYILCSVVCHTCNVNFPLPLFIGVFRPNMGRCRCEGTVCCLAWNI